MRERVELREGEIQRETSKREEVQGWVTRERERGWKRETTHELQERSRRQRN